MFRPAGICEITYNIRCGLAFKVQTIQYHSLLQMRSVLISNKTVLELSEEQFYDKFRTVLKTALLTILAVEPALLELSEKTGSSNRFFIRAGYRTVLCHF